MPGLVLKLRPEEEILVNGVILQNGERSAKLTVKTPDARILRLRDAIAAEDATTPVRRACLHLQFAVAGQPTEADTERLGAMLDALVAEARTLGVVETLDRARLALDAGNHYAAWRAVREIAEAESRAAQSSSGKSAPGASSSTGMA